VPKSPAWLVSLLRGRRQPAISREEPELERVVRDAAAPHRRAELRPTQAREQR
jgi:hypothetical protein